MATEKMAQIDPNFPLDGGQNGIVDKANKMLIHRRFEECLDACHKGLSLAKQHRESMR